MTEKLVVNFKKLVVDDERLEFYWVFLLDKHCIVLCLFWYLYLTVKIHSMDSPTT